MTEDSEQSNAQVPEVLEEKEPLLTRLANSDLPIAEDAERALELLHEAKGGPDE